MQNKIVLGVVFALITITASAAEFSFIDTQGETQSLARYKGRWVLLNLWATWCSPCLAEMPALETLSKSRKDLIVLGLAIDGQSEARVKEFAEKLHVTYPVIAGTAESAKPFKTRGYPTSFLFDTAGNRVFAKEGVLVVEEISQAINAVNRD